MKNNTCAQLSLRLKKQMEENRNRQGRWWNIMPSWKYEKQIIRDVITRATIYLGKFYYPILLN